ncbi:uL30 family ribosomal protein [Thermoproteota archaeon]
MAITKTKKVKKTRHDGSKTMAVVLIRGLIGTSPDVRTTLRMLNLQRKNSCTLIKNTENMMGMLFKVKDYVTYGEIDETVARKLQEKRGQKDKEGKIKKYFRLSPPKGGFERKGIKKSYSVGGVLGYRGNEMASLIKKMI